MLRIERPISRWRRQLGESFATTVLAALTVLFVLGFFVWFVATHLDRTIG